LIISSFTRGLGKWKPEEEEKLTQIVTKMTSQRDQQAGDELFWGQVSEAMGYTRGRQQCRDKWWAELLHLKSYSYSRYQE